MFENELIDLLAIFFVGGFVITFGALFGYQVIAFLQAIFRR
jgi:hypothetical protein